MSNWARRALAALAVTTALIAGTAATPAQAASITIGSVAKTNAPAKSKGTIKTPTITSSGVQIGSRSYVVTKGKKTVAKTSTQGKTIKLKPATYKVKSSVKYRTYTEKDEVVTKKTRVKTELHPEHKDWMYLSAMSVNPTKCRRTSQISMSNRAVIGHAWLHDMDWTAECQGADNNAYRGDIGATTWVQSLDNLDELDRKVSDYFPRDEWVVVKSLRLDDGDDLILMPFDWNATSISVRPRMTDIQQVTPAEYSYKDVYTKVKTGKKIRAYSGYKTITKTQTVKISRIKPPYSSKAKCTMTVAEYKKITKGMTVEQVRKIVGCKGRVDSYDKSTYDGELDITMSLKFSKSNYEWVGNGAKYGWVSFHNGHAYDKSYVDKNHSYSQFWSGI